jgi:putative ABC transport system permease protein
VLLLGAGLLIRSMILLLGVKPGYTTENVLTSLVSLPAATYATDAQRRDFFGVLVDRAGALPGVVAAGAVTNLPLTRSLGDLNIRIEGRPIGQGEVSPRLDWQVVTPGYFDAIGMTLERGRVIESSDDDRSPGVVVINEAAAKLQFPGEDAIGKRFTLGGNAGPGMVTVVGIVGDVRQSGLNATPQPEMYLAHRQFTFWNGGSAVGSMSLVVRTSSNAAAAAPSLRRVISELDPNLPAGPYRTMEEVRATSVAQPRFVTTLLALFAAVALLLASVGVYGMISLHVGLRRKEIGVRLALGARNREVLALVLRQGLGAVVAGLAIGTIAALALARSLSSLLYGVAPSDPLSLAAVIAVLSGSAIAACVGPVRRAVRTDPISTLRED